MKLLDVINRTPIPIPWDEGENIPWDDPDFSARMLKEHLDQNHDLASRRFAKIDEHVAWIHNEVLKRRPTRILDLGCGPGLYTSRLARLGHTCIGIDYSPASIAYAREQAEREHLSCTYVHDDIRAAEYPVDFGLVMLLYGELNVFGALDARAIVRKVSQALTCDGAFLVELHTLTAVQRTGQLGCSWYSSKSRLFSDKPHLCLTERTWDDASQAATIRYYVVDAETRQVAHYAQSVQGYSTAEYETMLEERGLEEIEFFPSLTGVKDPSQSDFVVVVAREGCEET